MTPDVVSQVKAQVSDSLRSKNGQQSGAVVRSGGFGPDKPQSFPLIPIVFTGGFLVSVGLFFAFRPNQEVQQSNTGQAQIDLAMQMLANQQGINDRLLQGQQELNAQMIQAQKDAKPTNVHVNCFLTRYCPGATPNASGQDYAIVGEGIQTARVNPNQALQPEQQIQPPNQPDPNAYPDPVQSVQYSPEQEAWARVYSDMRRNDNVGFQRQWQQCVSADWSIVTPQINCKALARELNR